MLATDQSHMSLFVDVLLSSDVGNMILTRLRLRDLLALSCVSRELSLTHIIKTLDIKPPSNWQSKGDEEYTNNRGVLLQTSCDDYSATPLHAAFNQRNMEVYFEKILVPVHSGLETTFRECDEFAADLQR